MVSMAFVQERRTRAASRVALTTRGRGGRSCSWRTCCACLRRRWYPWLPPMLRLSLFCDGHIVMCEASIAQANKTR
eukprot:scaffold375_cov378-Prasinococcus_capsulatus_cf.AAC.2